MKKVLAILLALAMVIATAAVVVSCGETGKEDNGGTDGTTEKKAVVLQSYDKESDTVALVQQAQNNETEAYGVLGEPSLTNGQGLVPQIEVAIDFQKEWKEITGFDGYPQASLIARGSFAKSNTEFISAFGTALAGNGTWLADEANRTSFVEALAAYNTAHADGYTTTLAGKTYTAETVERCNLSYQSAADVKASVDDYIQRLSGNAPAQGFYYTGTAAADAVADTVVDIYLPDGTPALAVANVFTDADLLPEGYTVNFHIVPAGQIGAIFNTQKDADLAIMPTIGAATVFSKGSDIQLVSTHVFGNLYIAAVNSSVETLEDLRGKTVNTTAATTIQLLQYLLKQNGIEYTA